MSAGPETTLLEWLDREADGCLGETEQIQLGVALQDDPVLRRRREEIRRVHQALASCRIEVEPGFRDAVMAALPVASWERSSRRSWGLAAAGVAVLAIGSSLLVSFGMGSEGAGPVVGLVAAMGQMIRSSALTGAGLLGASWRGVGMALEEMLSVSPMATLAFGVIVLSVNLLFFRLLRRRVRAPQLTGRGGSEPRAPKDQGS